MFALTTTHSHTPIHDTMSDADSDHNSSDSERTRLAARASQVSLRPPVVSAYGFSPARVRGSSPDEPDSDLEDNEKGVENLVARWKHATPRIAGTNPDPLAQKHHRYECLRQRRKDQLKNSTGAAQVEKARAEVEKLEDLKARKDLQEELDKERELRKQAEATSAAERQGRIQAEQATEQERELRLEAEKASVDPEEFMRAVQAELDKMNETHKTMPKDYWENVKAQYVKALAQGEMSENAIGTLCDWLVRDKIKMPKDVADVVAATIREAKSRSAR